MSSKIDWSHRDDHTKRKHDILREYIQPWIRATAGSHKVQFGQLYIVDCFAGRGIYEDGDPGSPYIIMSESAKFIEPYDCKLDCFFIEAEQEPFRTLEATVNGLQTKKVKAHTILGDFENEIYTVFRTIRAKDVPMFFFIDPAGYKQVYTDIIKNISNYKRVEILANIQSAGILRNILIPSSQPELWKVLPIEYPKGAEEEQIITDYELFLKKECKFDHIQHYPVSFDEKRHFIYYLIHATRKPAGRRIMQGILRKYGHGYRGPLEKLSQQQYSFGEQLEKNHYVQKIKLSLLNNYKSGDVVDKKDCESLIDKIPGCEGIHLTQALKQLQEEQRIERKSGKIKFL